MFIFVGVFLLQALISARVDPIMNFHFRYMIPFFPVTLAIFFILVSRRMKPAFRNLIIFISLVSIFIPVKQAFAFVERERVIMKAQWKYIKWAESLPEKTTISMTDMGRIPYYSRQVYNDLWGLLNEDTGHKGFNPVREFRRLPDYFVLVGHIENGKAKLRFGREQMIAYNKIFPAAYEFVTICLPDGADAGEFGYYYLVFKRKPEAAEKFSSSG
jgi:hypothetical protein